MLLIGLIRSLGNMPFTVKKTIRLILGAPKVPLLDFVADILLHLSENLKSSHLYDTWFLLVALGSDGLMI